MKGINCACTIQNPDALFICAKAKPRRQMFSAATATNVFCAKAKRQRQMFSVAKAQRQLQCFLRESEASAANVFCSESAATATITPRRNRSLSNKRREGVKSNGESFYSRCWSWRC
ncbi:hypothetical protein ACQKNB_15470 [Lysinibacillus xylanilyticus]|uniref:hypothetical protein n=1 Tax=Lysinibacillus xylanilyticus TaxID=582475 RepID=UPI003CFFCA6E